MSRRVLGTILVTAGALLAVTGAALSHNPTIFGAPPAVPGSLPPSTAQAPVAEPPAPATVKHSVANRMPTRVVVASLSAAAAVEPVGTAADGSLLLPAPDRVGWWFGGAQPGDPAGTTVLAGHVDTPAGTPGALYHLSAVRRGATLEVVTAAGRFTYRVTALQLYPKQRLPSDLFTRSGPHRLALITCGGPYRSGQGYADNVVAYAEPTK
ncbi:peptidase C60 sortase A and B [Kribbella flavida DSM 17836]|uniref:Peptidase C60 sortase A and B n=1 Tax=Kribbella flavida (strain DSM 17836 / JCM 10339 / NBRC 14399) TaxID=479435 RepID=D2PPQ0_KRIFD|nr:class F sortase [Kribbella flavida]ADB31012.1 peptidase C60 sortase A and B [Kribbella flavida DSM 17836]